MTQDRLNTLLLLFVDQGSTSSVNIHSVNDEFKNLLPVPRKLHYKCIYKHLVFIIIHFHKIKHFIIC